MITLNENILDENLHQLIDNIDVETIKQAAKEQPNFRSFYLSYGQEGHLIDLLKSHFDSIRKPTKETGSESKADAICIKNGKEFRFQLKQIVKQSIITMNGIKGKSKIFADPKLIRSEIRCKPNHKDYYLRTDLDVMVADISPLFGTPTFLYKMIDDFKSPPDGDQFIIPKNKIIYNPAGFYENGWTDTLNEITTKLFSNDYNLRNYDTTVPEQILTTKGKCINFMNYFD